MSERVLTQRELKRALLARQLLLERVDLPIPTVLDRIRPTRDVGLEHLIGRYLGGFGPARPNDIASTPSSR